MQVHVIQVDWSTHQVALQKIREIVFIQEQGVPREIEWDGEDDNCDHFLAVNEAGIHIGCARLMPSGQIGRMAVLEAFRGYSHGRALLDAAIEAAAAKGFDRVHLHAQAEAIGFYEKRGFLAVGNRFMEAGIEHQEMHLNLPIRFEATAGLPKPTVVAQPAPEKHTDAELLVITGEQMVADMLRQIIESGTRQVDILSPKLDHVLFDQPALVDAISDLARGHRQSQVRILVGAANTKMIVQRGHQLLNLARRLDSKIKIRALADMEEAETWLTADHDGYWLLPDHSEYQGVANVWDPVTTNRLKERFEELWRRSEEDPELRLLQL